MGFIIAYSHTYWLSYFAYTCFPVLHFVPLSLPLICLPSTKSSPYYLRMCTHTHMHTHASVCVCVHNVHKRENMPYVRYIIFHLGNNCDDCWLMLNLYLLIFVRNGTLFYKEMRKDVWQIREKTDLFVQHVVTMTGVIYGNMSFVQLGYL